MGAEHAALLAHLGGQRRHVLGIVEGLDDEQMRRPVLPSGWSCAGLVQHLTLDVEKFWFRGVIAGEQEVIDEVAAAAGVSSWTVADDVPASAVVARYAEQVALADAVLARTPLDAEPAWWPDFFGEWRLDDLRDVILHVITETACHAGHLDATRELIDGRQWMVQG
ncbi:hypothetical protein N865_13750 [Intrasporangium oryzae NRRL B-24470]|uniref:DUF664 domain-containing protein n=1 Tax=Intrasporangium oryzae NRRL B-24470 TaxID=1386089 RepID=W9G3S6_9MICO|nr:hypothetical protein N865_13750 [Intrasporangium oryzae NRRL B-24470]